VTRSCTWLVVALMLLAPEAYGFSYSASTNSVGYSAEFRAPVEEELVASTALNGGSLSNTINGRGDIHENHFVGNGAGATALVRADVINASSYTYSYELVPSPVMAQNAAEVQASEHLDVKSADYIRALALAAAPNLYSSVSTEVRGGSLSGYSNKAVASAESAKASQSLDAASRSVQTYSRSEFALKGERHSSHVTTSIQGDLTKYSDTATSMVVADMAEYASVVENSHIVGSFTSNALEGDQSNIRRSDFGTEFDLKRSAWVGYASMGGGTGDADTQGYYVKPGEKIQDAINAAKSGDTINVTSGTYLENLAIGKDLNVYGADPASTIIDGSNKGSVISITSPCTIGNLKIQNGYATSGGGIYINGVTGTVTLTNCIISNNQATNSGGGIFTSGDKLDMNGCSISGNSAPVGGGISIVGRSTVVAQKISISGNTATRLGGGVVSGGKLEILDGIISGNSAKMGGGIALAGGACRIFPDVYVSGNKAEKYGGGVFLMSGASFEGISSVRDNSPNDIVRIP